MADSNNIGIINEWVLLKREFYTMILDLGKKYIVDTVESNKKLEVFADQVSESMAKQRFLLSKAIKENKTQEAKLREQALVLLTSQIAGKMHRLEFQQGQTGFNIFKDALFFSVKTMVSLIVLSI